MTEERNAIPEDALEQAAAWLYRLDASPGDDRLRAALDEWVAASEVHARAWQATTRAWELTGALTASPKSDPGPRDAQAPAAVPVRRAVVPATRVPAARSRRRRYAAAALALVAALALPVLLPGVIGRIDGDFVTSAGVTLTATLADGSTVHLGPETALTVSFGESARDLGLIRGEAFFEVTPDPTRPFVVRADDSTVTVTGTAFDVRLSQAVFEVAVSRGHVRVAPSGHGTVEIGRGDRVTLERSTGSVQRSTTRPEDIAAWRGGRLVVTGADLDAVVEDIDRYQRGAIVIADPALRGRRVTGVYDLRDPSRALQALVAPYGSVVHELTPYLLVVTAF